MGASGYTQAFTVGPDSGLRGPGIRRRRKCCRRGDRSFSPLEFVVPACKESCFSTSLLKQHLPWEITMFRLGQWMLLGLAVWVWAAQEAKAGIGFQPVSPDEIKMTSEPLAPG